MIDEDGGREGGRKTSGREQRTKGKGETKLERVFLGDTNVNNYNIFAYHRYRRLNTCLAPLFGFDYKRVLVKRDVILQLRQHIPFEREFLRLC